VSRDPRSTTRTATIQKALYPDLSSETASQRLAKLAINLQESCPTMSDRECCEIVAKKNPELYALAVADCGVEPEPIAKGQSVAEIRHIEQHNGAERSRKQP
jgi:hypothetical protein